MARQPPLPPVVIAAPVGVTVHIGIAAPVVIAAPVGVTVHIGIAAPVGVTMNVGITPPMACGADDDERGVGRGAAAEHCPVAEPPPPASRRAPIDRHAP